MCLREDALCLGRIVLVAILTFISSNFTNRNLNKKIVFVILIKLISCSIMLLDQTLLGKPPVLFNFEMKVQLDFIMAVKCTRSCSALCFNYFAPFRSDSHNSDNAPAIYHS